MWVILIQAQKDPCSADLLGWMGPSPRHFPQPLTLIIGELHNMGTWSGHQKSHLRRDTGEEPAQILYRPPETKLAPTRH